MAKLQCKACRTFRNILIHECILVGEKEVVKQAQNLSELSDCLNTVFQSNEIFSLQTLSARSQIKDQSVTCHIMQYFKRL